MIVSAHQPAYLPWLGYFHKIMLSDVFVIMDDVQFEKNSFINRNRILSGGKELMLTIPVRLKGHTSKTIADIEVSDHFWRRKHLKSIEQAYCKAPFFETAYALIAPVLEKEHRFLVEYVNELTAIFLEHLDIRTRVLFASELEITSQKLDYVIELTHKVDGDIFVFGALGKNYGEADQLNRCGIKPYFQDFRHPVYRQQSKEFVCNMSILDIMFNEPRDKITDIIMSGNISKEELTECVA